MSNEDRYKKALEEIFEILKKHPTNEKKLIYGEEGYCSKARYAYLVALDVLRANTQE